VTTSAVSVAGLSVYLNSGTPVVEGVSFDVAPGEILGLVGESGSGKTTTGLALLGLARPGTRLTGNIIVNGIDVAKCTKAELRHIRGRVISFVPQDPSASFDPMRRIGDQIGEIVKVHETAFATDDAVLGALSRVNLPNVQAFARRFPHELSGGQQQRVAIARALACRPKVVVFDEPTTGLDVLIQAAILREIDRLRREDNLAVVYISHDLAVVAGLADRIAVMYAGRVVEVGRTRDLVARPRHPYTRGLLSSVPDVRRPGPIVGIPGATAAVGEWPTGCAFSPRCNQRVPRCETVLPELEETTVGNYVRCFEWRRTPPRQHRALPDRTEPGATLGNDFDTLPAVDVESLTATYGGDEESVVRNVSFSIRRDECMALVGESGSGKTTIGRCLVGLHAPRAGVIRLDGVTLPSAAKARPRDVRRKIQAIFQDPSDALNPRRRILDSVAWPARLLRGLGRREAEVEAFSLLERMGLPQRVGERYPRELSGGERQRVCVARALIARPSILICDEITSALDVSVQAAVIDLLRGLRRESKFAMLFISHDLALVASFADRVLIIQDGVLCESGTVADVMTRPEHPYPRALLAAVPSLDATTSDAAGTGPGRHHSRSHIATPSDYPLDGPHQ
jgi:peptide/nickel transport system ATP-binding protein